MLAEYPVAFSEIPDGFAGSLATLSAMRKIVLQFRHDPRIKSFALKLTAGCDEGRDEVEAIFYYVRDRFVYVPDPDEFEMIAWPTTLLKIGQGDCDDKAILLNSLLESIGYKTRFKAIGYEPGVLSHVFSEVRLKNSWVSMDANDEAAVLGWVPPGIVFSHVVHL